MNKRRERITQAQNGSLTQRVRNIKTRQLFMQQIISFCLWDLGSTIQLAVQVNLLPNSIFLICLPEWSRLTHRWSLESVVSIAPFPTTTSPHYALLASPHDLRYYVRKCVSTGQNDARQCCALYAWILSVLPAILRGRFYYYPHFAEGKPETQRH